MGRGELYHRLIPHRTWSVAIPKRIIFKYPLIVTHSGSGHAWGGEEFWLVSGLAAAGRTRTIFNATELVIEAFTQRLRDAYTNNFGGQHSDYPEVLAWAGRMALERIADSDALYHDAEHTLLVTLVGQEILRGRHIRDGGVTPDDWLHFVLALMCHDIGYVRGVCNGDRAGEYVIDAAGNTIEAPTGASDAFLTPHHVERGKIFVRERFGSLSIFDTERVCRALELTRFPVPDETDSKDTEGMAGLVRAADLIGQLADPNYLRKINRLFAEFEETGANAQLGYSNPAELAAGYPAFFWGAVHPFIKDGLGYLQVTQGGKQWIANLYAQLFATEHQAFTLGPDRGNGHSK
jgi:hypothetical protein